MHTMSNSSCTNEEIDLSRRKLRSTDITARLASRARRRSTGAPRVISGNYTSDFPDMVEPAYILFDGKGGGEFAFGGVTGTIRGAGDGDAIEFSWDGNDEMEEASGDGWAELQPNGLAAAASNCPCEASTRWPASRMSMLLRSATRTTFARSIASNSRYIGPIREFARRSVPVDT